MTVEFGSCFSKVFSLLATTLISNQESSYEKLTTYGRWGTVYSWARFRLRFFSQRAWFHPNLRRYFAHVCSCECRVSRNGTSLVIIRLLQQRLLARNEMSEYGQRGELNGRWGNSPKRTVAREGYETETTRGESRKRESFISECWKHRWNKRRSVGVPGGYFYHWALLICMQAIGNRQTVAVSFPSTLPARRGRRGRRGWGVWMRVVIGWGRGEPPLIDLQSSGHGLSF